MSVQVQINAVANVNASAFPEFFNEGAPRTIVVQPRPGGTMRTLAADILIALEKRSWAGKFDGPNKLIGLRALQWIEASRIARVIVLNAEWLDSLSEEYLREVASQCEVWCLFSELITLKARSRGPAKEVCVRSLAELIDNRERTLAATTEPWADFPIVPLVGPFAFLATCRETMEDSDFKRVDGAVARGAGAIDSVARRYLEGNGAPLDALVENPDLPIWPSLAIIRGAQLGAIASGLKLEFNLQRWFYWKQLPPQTPGPERAALTAAADPLFSFLLIVASTTQAPAWRISQLKVGELAPGGEYLESGGRRAPIASALRSIARAYLEMYCHGCAPSDPLFRAPSGAPMPATAIASRLRSFAVRNALPIPPAGESGPRPNKSSPLLARFGTLRELGDQPR